MTKTPEDNIFAQLEEKRCRERKVEILKQIEDQKTEDQRRLDITRQTNMPDEPKLKAEILDYHPSHGRSHYHVLCFCGAELDVYCWSGSATCPSCKRHLYIDRYTLDIREVKSK